MREILPGDYDVERMEPLEEKAVTDDQQGRAPFDDHRPEYVHTDDEPVTSEDAVLVKLPPRPHLKTVAISAMVPTVTPIVLVGENLKRRRMVIQVVTPYAAGTPDTGVVYIGEQMGNATVSGGFRVDSRATLELWGATALYATASTNTEVRVVTETEVC